MEKFRTGRLVARSWQIEDLPFGMELLGDPAVTALIDSRGKLTEAQVREKLYAEIERERSRVQYWRCSITAMAIRWLRRASALGLYTRRGGFRNGVPSREALGQWLRNGSCSRRARICVGKIAGDE